MHLSEALDLYLKDHDKGDDPGFARRVRLAIDQALKAVGDLPLTDFRKSDAASIRDYLLATKIKTTSVKRRLADIQTVFNHARAQSDQDINNPFEGLKIRGYKSDAKKREAFTQDELETIAKACVALGDDIRRIIAMCLDTGARLGEIVGLRVDDVRLEDPIPHLIIQPHATLKRTIKTSASHRKVPLVGMALWGATRAAEGGCSLDTQRTLRLKTQRPSSGGLLQLRLPSPSGSRRPLAFPRRSTTLATLCGTGSSTRRRQTGR
jgi:integrase